MDDDEQPRIAILGAGPIGLEAALYARYLGYPVALLEAESMPAANVFKLAGTNMEGCFAELASRLGVAALQAQNPDWSCPAASAMLTAAEYHEHYLLPLAQSDLVADALFTNSKVLAVARPESDAPWRIEIQNVVGVQTFYEAEIVIDATGQGSTELLGTREEEPVSDAEAESLCFQNPTADFYVLGSKVVELPGGFSFGVGLNQIRELFAILGEREDLDLYATMRPIGE